MSKVITLILLLAAFSGCRTDPSHLTPSEVLIQSATTASAGDSTGYLKLRSKRSAADIRSNPDGIAGFFNEWKGTHIAVKVDSELIHGDSAKVYYHFKVTPKAGVDTIPPSAGPGYVRLLKEDGDWKIN